MTDTATRTTETRTTEGGQTVLRTVTTRTETEHVAVVTLERKDDAMPAMALTTTAGSVNVGGGHGGGSAAHGASTTTVPALSTTSHTITTATSTGGGGGSTATRSRDTSLHRETAHHYSGTGGAGTISSHHLPTIATPSAATTTSTMTSTASAMTTVPTATLSATTTTGRPLIQSQESYTMVKTKSKAPQKSQTSSSSKFITSSAGGGGGYTADTEGSATHERHVVGGVPLVPQIHHEHYQHHVGTGSAGIERKVPMTTTTSSAADARQHDSAYHYSSSSKGQQHAGATMRSSGGGNDTDTDTEDEKRRTATSSRTGYHSATEQSYASQKHHHLHKNYDNDYHQRKKRENKLQVTRNRARRRAALRRWCRCDSVCFLLMLAVLHILVASTIIGLNIASWIVSGMWLIKVIDFLFWVFALGFLAFLTGVVGLVITYKLRSPYGGYGGGGGGGGVGRSRTINTLRGGQLHGGVGEFSKEEERLVGLSSHGMGGSSATGAIANDHADMAGGDLHETETSYGDVQAQRRKHRIHYALLFLLCIIVIVLAIVAYLLITYDYHEPMTQRRDDNARDYSVFDEARRPQEATFSKYFTYLFNRVNNLSDQEQVDSAHQLNTLRSLLITFVALELGLAVITLGLAFVYLFRGYRLRCPCLEPDSQSSNDMGMANGGTQPVIVSPSQMTLGSRGGGGGMAGGTLSGYGLGGTGGHVVREFDREERETVRLVA